MYTNYILFYSGLWNKEQGKTFKFLALLVFPIKFSLIYTIYILPHQASHITHRPSLENMETEEKITLIFVFPQTPTQKYTNQELNSAARTDAVFHPYNLEIISYIMYTGKH